MHPQVAQVTPNTDFDLLLQDSPWLATSKLVVKPDMLFGQRGKHDLVGLNLDFVQVGRKERTCAAVRHASACPPSYLCCVPCATRHVPCAVTHRAVCALCCGAQAKDFTPST